MMAFRHEQTTETIEPATQKRERNERADAARRRFREAGRQVADRLHVDENAQDGDDLALHEAATALVKHHGM